MAFQSAAELEQFSIQLVANDPDQQASDLEFSIIGPDFGAIIDSGTGEFTWTPSEIHGASIFYFVVQVSDGFAGTAMTILVQVDAVFENFEAWQMDYFPAGLSKEHLTMEADIDYDGYSSLMEFATGMDPFTANPVHPLEIFWNPINEAAEFETGLRSGISGLTTGIDLTENFQDWTTVDLTFDANSQTWSSSSSEVVLESAVGLGDRVWSLHLRDASGLKQFLGESVSIMTIRLNL